MTAHKGSCIGGKEIGYAERRPKANAERRLLFSGTNERGRGLENSKKEAMSP